MFPGWRKWSSFHFLGVLGRRKSFFHYLGVLALVTVTCVIFIGNYAFLTGPTVKPKQAWRTSASLSLSARSSGCKSPSSTYERWLERGGYGASRDANPGMFLREYADVSPSPDKIVASFGCNKGEDLVAVLQLWDKTLWDTSRYVALWNERNKFQTAVPKLAASDASSKSDRQHLAAPDASSGGEAHAGTRAHSVRHTSPLGICVDANLGSVEAIEKVSSAMGLDKPHGGWERPYRVINAALSNVTDQFMDFPLEPPGSWWSNTDTLAKEWAWYERLGVYFGIGHRLHKVPVKMVDELLLSDPSLAGSDLLISTDVNGHDALVLFGMAKTLATGRVRYIEFEYDPKGDWNERKLSEVILFLDSFHFDCFWLMTDGLSRITGCWDPRYDEPATGWVNIACMSREDDLWPPIIKRWSHES